MIHQGQRLPLGLETGHDAFGVHSQLDDFQRRPPVHRFLLLGHIDHAATPSADSLQQLVRPDSCSNEFIFVCQLVNIPRQAGRVFERSRKFCHREPRHAAFLEDFFRGGLRGQQFIHHRAKRRISLTGAVQKNSALIRGVDFERGAKNFLRSFCRRFNHLVFLD